MAYNISNDALTDEQLDYVEEVLGQYASETSVGSISELDGFFAAIVSGPQAITFDDWYAALWGGPDQLPVFKDDKQFQKFFDLLIQHMNQLAMLLEEDFENFAPIFNLFDDEEVVSVEDWCYGYERGVVVGGSWLDMPDQEQDLLALITLHTQGRRPAQTRRFGRRAGCRGSHGNDPDGRDPSAPVLVRAAPEQHPGHRRNQSRAQRSLPVRQWQEIQAVLPALRIEHYAPIASR